MGGVGKTQLAAAYARRSWEQGVGLLVWVTATSRPGIISGYADAAVRLGLADREDPDQAAEAFLGWTATTETRWLVVLDDIQDPADVRGLWPPVAPAGRVVATTRLQHSALTGAGRRLVQIDVFTPAEARAYLTAKLPERADANGQLDALVEDLGRLPLALAQAAAFIRDEDISIATYRRRLASRLLAHAAPQEDGLPDDHKKIVSATWDLSIDKADKARPSGLARPLLLLASVLDANGIPADVLTSVPARQYLTTRLSGSSASTTAVDVVDVEMVDEALRVLHRFSLIDHDRSATHREVRIHQLIQRVTRENLDDPDQYTALAHAAADALLAVWPDLEHDQLGAILRANTTALRQTTGTTLWRWNGEAHQVLFRAADSLGDTGQVTAALTEYTHLHHTSHQTLGPDHPDTLTTRHNLARWRGKAGDPAGAIIAFDELLNDCLHLLGPNHPNTLTTRHNLAYWRGEAGDPASAATAFEELLNDRLHLYSPNHPDTLTTRGNLADWRGQSGDPAGAATAFEELLNDCLHLLGPNHPNTLTTRHNLAYWRGEAGDPASAATAFEELLNDCLHLLGPNHPDTLTTRHNLAYWRGEAGDPASAATAFEELLNDRLHLLGPNHPDTLTTRHNLAHWRGRAGNMASAITALEELLNDCLRVLGPDHSITKAVQGLLTSAPRAG